MNYKLPLSEIELIFKSIKKANYETFLHGLYSHLKKYPDCNIVGLGSGRMGYSLRSLIMRLSHMNFNSSMIGDTNVPAVNNKTIILINSSSGETQSNILFANQAKSRGSLIFLVTSNEISTIAKVSNFVLPYTQIKSSQLMKSAYEQFSLIFFDILAKDLLEKLEIPISFIESNHSILE